MPSNVESPSKLALPQFKKLKFNFEPQKHSISLSGPYIMVRCLGDYEKDYVV
jgi:hypothetical protein